MASNESGLRSGSPYHANELKLDPLALMGKALSPEVIPGRF